MPDSHPMSPVRPSAPSLSAPQRLPRPNLATRERLWIDRVASAWLIRRFIDPDARFLWLKRVKDCPKRAVGFEFDAAEFTHVGSKVTFEVLVASFDLERDVGLVRLGALVHHPRCGRHSGRRRAGPHHHHDGLPALCQDNDDDL